MNHGKTIKLENIYLLLYLCNLSVYPSIILGFRHLRHISYKNTDVSAFKGTDRLSKVVELSMQYYGQII